MAELWRESHQREFSTCAAKHGASNPGTQRSAAANASHPAARSATRRCGCTHADARIVAAGSQGWSCDVDSCSTACAGRHLYHRQFKRAKRQQRGEHSNVESAALPAEGEWKREPRHASSDACARNKTCRSAKSEGFYRWRSSKRRCGSDANYSISQRRRQHRHRTHNVGDRQ